MTKKTAKTDSPASARLDLWLWATRFFKTRRLATDAIRLNRIMLNGNSAKAASKVKLGDLVLIRKGPLEFTVKVEQLLQQRVSATLAQQAYLETEDSLAKRQRQKDLAKQMPRIEISKHKPDSRSVRQMRRHKRGERG